ncbi:hypothetical protein BHE74_00051971 [Ensete ventricosum]|nr:hypothetical protein BHE74_00051971 [Ensete ventricosum]RZS24203.1 hypothetical protein BHM03_00057244 [Ensete ventricosum]
MEFRSLKAVEKGGAKKTEPRIREKGRGGAIVPGLLRSTLPRSRSGIGRGKGFRVRRSENERRRRAKGGKAVVAPRVEHPCFSPSWVGTWEIMGVAVGVPLVLPDLDDEPAYP